MYKEEKALYQENYSWDGFEWLDADNSKQSTLAFIRHGKRPADDLVVLLNFVPENFDEYRIGVPKKGIYKEIFNSDCTEFGGSGRINPGYIASEPVPWHGKENSIVIRTPPIGGVVLKRAGRRELEELKNK